ncbi:hypothetical protein LZ31DRAFT_550679 [Colletotrichum somersetense]|nr:hypothetical protein LZ31DRAFT_550679 [Colletotrichum somersetense]
MASEATAGRSYFCLAFRAPFSGFGLTLASSSLFKPSRVRTRQRFKIWTDTVTGSCQKPDFILRLPKNSPSARSKGKEKAKILSRNPAIPAHSGHLLCSQATERHQASFCPSNVSASDPPHDAK